MNDRARQRAVDNAISAALSEQAGLELYRRSARMQGRRMVGVRDRAAPLEFDERGFPVRRPNARFALRVARLLRPD